MGQDSPEETRWRKLFQSLLASSTAEYSERHKHLAHVRTIFYDELAVEMQRAIRESLRTRPRKTFAEKVPLAKWLGQQLKEVGLSIRCPVTGRSAALVASPEEGNDPSDQGYFALEVRDDEGHTVRTVSNRRKLPEMDFMELNPPWAPALSARRLKDSGDQRSR